MVMIRNVLGCNFHCRLLSPNTTGCVQGLETTAVVVVVVVGVVAPVTIRRWSEQWLSLLESNY